MSLQSDLMLAMSGVLNPKPFRPGDKDKSLLLLSLWEKRLRKWLTSDEPKPMEMADQDVERIRKQLATPLLPTRQKALTDVYITDRPDLVDGYQASLQEARRYLNLRYPLHQVTSVLGPEEQPPSHDEVARWLTIVAVVDDPEFFIGEIEAGTVESSQVRALEATHRDLYLGVHSILVDLLGELRAKKVVALSYQKDVILQIVMQSKFERLTAPPAPPVPVPEPKDEVVELELRTQAPTEKLLTPLQ